MVAPLIEPNALTLICSLLLICILPASNSDALIALCAMPLYTSSVTVLVSTILYVSDIPHEVSFPFKKDENVSHAIGAAPEQSCLTAVKSIFCCFSLIVVPSTEIPVSILLVR